MFFTLGDLQPALWMERKSRDPLNADLTQAALLNLLKRESTHQEGMCVLALIKQNSPTPCEYPAPNSATFPYMVQQLSQCKGAEL